jgi:hypothetical protein
MCATSTWSDTRTASTAKPLYGQELYRWFESQSIRQAYLFEISYISLHGAKAPFCSAAHLTRSKRPTSSETEVDLCFHCAGCAKALSSFFARPRGYFSRGT